MKKLIFLFVIVISVLTYAAWLDTGFIEYKQPNGVTFIAKMWGDEFFHWIETEDGYQIYQKGNWYYYAILNEIGDFTNKFCRRAPLFQLRNFHVKI
jgi:hypothetical protein